MLTEGASAAMPTSILWFTRHDKKISTLIFCGPQYYLPAGSRHFYVLAFTASILYKNANYQ